MPEISRFFGIVIKMFFSEHPPPHFHVEYGDEKAVFDIRMLIVIRGSLSPRALGLVVEWASQHQSELLDLWDRSSKSQSLYKVPPLK
jgi:hypothetical protein